MSEMMDRSLREHDRGLQFPLLVQASRMKGGYSSWKKKGTLVSYVVVVERQIAYCLYRSDSGGNVRLHQ